MTDKNQVNKLFRQFKNKNVVVELRDNNQAEGKIIAIDNYLNIVLENDNGIETLKGGNIVYVSLNE
ncbi:MAG: LSM domain protein [Methanobrevibacter thaueri]|jgi:small nuclear ribonucleoprotein (snRNP)-like protein|uniref:LSM domain-containing protein n=1 Tax=Methanobrevibacter thaueri TaxID=190975 RepID=UPI0026EE1346|nr:LSM domain-containing protein [Methanobrevibacter thaueri]MBE6495712.1 LSM domain protein [Methanobrevibacter thaueri]